MDTQCINIIKKIVIGQRNKNLRTNLISKYQPLHNSSIKIKNKNNSKNKIIYPLISFK